MYTLGTPFATRYLSVQNNLPNSYMCPLNNSYQGHMNNILLIKLDTLNALLIVYIWGKMMGICAVYQYEQPLIFIF